MHNRDNLVVAMNCRSKLGRLQSGTHCPYKGKLEIQASSMVPLISDRGSGEIAVTTIPCFNNTQQYTYLHGKQYDAPQGEQIALWPLARLLAGRIL